MTLTEQLADAQQKYHLLVAGQAARVVVDQNGERVEFTSANPGRLQAYIHDLKRQLGQLSCPGPMTPYF